MSRSSPRETAGALRVLVIVPTYNESENVERLCLAVLDLGREYEVLVVDDNSPDGTAEIVEALTGRSGRVHLLRRPGKLGLGTAHMDGYRWALAGQYDRAVTMDADFSHPPERIPAMVRASRENDVVIGSRYVAGGSWEGWPLRRVLLSRISNGVARLALRLEPKDCTGAFRCFRREVLARVPLENIRARGYAFQEEMLWQCSNRGGRMSEVPITFVQRRRGTTKISPREIVLAMWTIVRLLFTPEGQRRKQQPESQSMTGGSP